MHLYTINTFCPHTFQRGPSNICTVKAELFGTEKTHLSVSIFDKTEVKLRRNTIPERLHLWLQYDAHCQFYDINTIIKKYVNYNVFYTIYFHLKKR